MGIADKLEGEEKARREEAEAARGKVAKLELNLASMKAKLARCRKEDGRPWLVKCHEESVRLLEVMLLEARA